MMYEVTIAELMNQERYFHLVYDKKTKVWKMVTNDRKEINSRRLLEKVGVVDVDGVVELELANVKIKYRKG